MVSNIDKASVLSCVNLLDFSQSIQFIYPWNAVLILHFLLLTVLVDGLFHPMVYVLTLPKPAMHMYIITSQHIPSSHFICVDKINGKSNKPMSDDSSMIDDSCFY